MSFSWPTLAFIGDIGGGELVLIFLVVLMLFGGEKMPEMARGMGKAIREFKKATSGIEEQIKQAMAEEPPKPRPVPVPTLPPVYTPTPPPAVAITPVDAPPAPTSAGDRHTGTGTDKTE